MPKRRSYDEERHAQFVICSCYHRRRLLDGEPLRDALLELLAEKLEVYAGVCSGFVVMPDHVHLIVWSSARHCLLNEPAEVPLEWVF